MKQTENAAAVREVCEETGYQIEVRHLVGEYRQPQMPNGGVLKYLIDCRNPCHLFASIWLLHVEITFIWFMGPVLESFPGQATAAQVVIEQ